AATLEDNVVNGNIVYGCADDPTMVYIKLLELRLHQAPRAWFKGDILLVQVYVDDIIFGSTRKEMCTEFEKMMHNQDKYVDEILKKFSFLTVKTTSTPMETSKPLMKDETNSVVANSTTEAKYMAAASCSPEELGEGSEIPIDPQHTPTIIQPSTSQPQKKQPRRKRGKTLRFLIPLWVLQKPISDEAGTIRVLDLENTKTSQAAEITKLKERVKKLERRNKSRTLGLKRLRKVGRFAQVVSSEVEGLGAQEDAFKHERKIADLDDDAEEVKVENAVSTSEVTTVSATTYIINCSKTQAQLNAELEEEEKLVKQREEDANIAEWDNVQAMIDADYELAIRLQAQEQEELTVEEKSKLS
ncbi:hypothetical protein Tco_1062172, partial [Tanacetum coccineum]